MKVNKLKYWGYVLSKENKIQKIYHKSRNEYILKFLPKGERILEVGFGDGSLLKRLKKFGKQVYGFDLPHSFSKTLKNRLRGVKLKFGYIDNIPFKNNFFDIIIASQVLESLEEDELKNFIKESGRILKKGGILIITVPYKEKIEENMILCPYCLREFHPFLHLQSFDEVSLKKLFEEFDFKFVFSKKIINVLDLSEKFQRIPFFLRFFLSQILIVFGAVPICLLMEVRRF